ncbi:MAG: SIR2 family protein [Pirellulales bacterium]|nr:SIR2 family protein [Pirellulales bacterium]
MDNSSSIDRVSSDWKRVEDFLDAIKGELAKGWGFMPMLGSGISVPSGIPTADKFARYFLFCLKEALNKNADPHSWDWPPFAVVKRPIAGDGDLTRLKQKCQGVISHLNNGDSKSPAAKEGIDVLKKLEAEIDQPVDADNGLSDWRLGMEGLSRLFNSGSMVGHRDERVIDSFFAHLISSARRPSFGHVMLAHLADTLRIRTILTTNFDTLAEDAFLGQGMPLAPFDVHRSAGLPDPRLVLRRPAIVKLHGGRFGLRADKTLFDDPELREKETFLEYFGSFPKTAPDDKPRARKHLLVLGASCGEKRTMGFLRFSLESFKEVHVFWVCFGPNEEKKVTSEFKEVKNLGGRLHVVVCPDIGLLLFQLYQRLHNSLPPAGADYPAFCRVPADPYPPNTGRDNDAAKKLTRKLEKRVAAKLDAPSSNASRVIVVDGKNGVSSICSAAWDRLARRYHCVWLELDDFLGPGDLFVAVLAEIARNVSVSPPGPFHPEITPEQWRGRLAELVGGSHRKLVVFLNGRDGPGQSAGWESPEIPGVAEGHEPSSRWSASQIATFWSFLATLKKENAEWLADVVVVVMARSVDGEGALRIPARMKMANKDRIGFRKLPFDDTATIQSNVCEWLDTSDPCESEAARWDRGERVAARERFLYGFTLFRHSRHWAALCSWGLIKAPNRLSQGKDNDETRAEDGTRWISELRERRALRDKPGGFSWMHRNVRDGLRKRLEEREPRLKGLRAECHQGIADWYVKLFRSSNDPLAALESLYHRLCCIEFADRSTTGDECGDPEHIKETAFIEAITTLKLAKERIVSCGYFTASCNLVRQIAQAIARVKLRRAAELARMCADALRDFAREAADFRMAFRINEQLHDVILASPQDSGQDGERRLARRDYLSLEAKYYKAVILTGLRSYGRAEDELHDLFRQLGFPEIAPGTHLWQGYSVHDMRRMGRAWARSRKEDADLLKLAIRAVRRYMFLEMLIAQANECPTATQASAGAAVGTTHNKECVKRRQYSEVMYVLGTEIMRYVDDHDFLQVENAYLRTLYGVLMATLDRFYEAHRRLNEASGYLAHSPRRNDSVARAVADLRRAETYLLHGEKVAIVDGKEETSLAFLEDAVCCLDRARVSLDEGQRKDVWWWTLMYELQMRICLCLVRMSPGVCTHKNLVLAARFCHEPRCEQQGRCTQTLRDAAQLIVADPFRMARLTKMFRDCQLPSGGASQDAVDEELNRAATNLKRIMEARGEEGFGRYSLDDRIREYIEHVQKDLSNKKDDTA